MRLRSCLRLGLVRTRHMEHHRRLGRPRTRRDDTRARLVWCARRTSRHGRRHGVRSTHETLRLECLPPWVHSRHLVCSHEPTPTRKNRNQNVMFSDSVLSGVVRDGLVDRRTGTPKNGARAGTKRKRSVSPDLRMGWWAHPRICVPTISVPALHRRLESLADARGSRATKSCTRRANSERLSLKFGAQYGSLS